MLRHDEESPVATRAPAQGDAWLGPRYRVLAELGRGAMGTVYRCLDRESGREVALKRVRTVLRGSSREIEALRTSIVHEFRLLASLRHVNIIGVRDFGFLGPERQPFFTMELLSQAETLLEAAARREPNARVELLVQLLRALQYLHRRGVLHRDLKPSNILVAGEHLKVVDFGLSVLRGNADEHDPSGSLAYLAPEQLRGAAASDASDIYALGVLTYEIFAGCHPFDASSQASLFRSVLEDEPDLGCLELPPMAAALVGQLLEREPSRRPTDLAAIAARLGEALGLDVPIETLATRDSFLHGAEFVGRQAELTRLASRLDDATSGRGATVLLTGESGVGKSRLLEELRVRALVSGVMVLTGQAVSEGGAPYHMWHGVLRGLCLAVTPTPSQWAMLEPVLSRGDTTAAPRGTDALAESPIDSLIDAEGARDRLRRVVEALLERLETPTLIVFEDLHWARSESLRLLESICQVVAEHALLVVATWRDTEAPRRVEQLLAACPGEAVERLRLARLNRHEVARLSASMLGEAGQRDDVLDFLMAETEGNPFFLVEVSRVLAEEAGRLDRIGSVALPEQVLPDGIKRVVERHLARLSATARPLLDVVAVCGRVVSQDLLRELVPAAERERWLALCADAAVLEPTHDDWRFVHDKVRESVIEAMSPGRLRQTHRRVALAIERTAASPLAEAAALAVHWEHAGDARRAVHYLGLAGARSLASGAYAEAVEVLCRALALSAPGAPAWQDNPQLRLRRAIWERQVGQAWLGSGRPDESREHIERCLRVLGHPVSRSRAGAALMAARELAVRVAPSSRGRRLLARMLRSSEGRGSAPGPRLEAVRCYEALVEAHHHGGSLPGMLHAALCTVNLAEGLERRLPELARAYIDVAATLSVTRWRAPAEGFVERAWQVLGSVAAPGDIQARLWVLQLSGFVRLAHGEWSLARELFKELGELGRRLDIFRFWETANIALLWMDDYCGHCPLGWTAVLASAEERGDRQIAAWAYMHMAERALRDGELALARRLMAGAAAHGRSCAGRHGATLLRGLEVLELHRRGDDDVAALEDAGALLRVLGRHVPVAQYLLPAYLAVAETHLAALERTLAAGEAPRRSLVRRCRAACSALSRFARAFRFGQPAALRHRAWLSALLDGVAAAAPLWRQARVACLAFEALPERALTELDVARLMPRGAARDAALARAEALLQACGELAARRRARALREA